MKTPFPVWRRRDDPEASRILTDSEIGDRAVGWTCAAIFFFGLVLIAADLIEQVVGGLPL